MATRSTRPFSPDVHAIVLADVIEDVLRRGLKARMAVSGASMAPTLGNGDLVSIEAVDNQTLRIGDLVLYRGAAGNLVLHRVLRMWRDRGRGPRVQTRGDANLHLDTTVARRQILGRVRRIEKRDTRVVDLQRTGERLRAIAIAWRNLLVSGITYKLCLPSAR
jgi:signal peptidase I